MNFIPLAAVYAAGVYTSRYFNVILLFIALIPFTILCALNSRRHKRPEISAALIAALFILGLGSGRIADDFSGRKISGYFGKYAVLQGCIYDLPYDNNGINRYIVHINNIEYKENTQTCGENIIVNSEEVFKCGDSVKIYGKIQELKEQSGEYGFNAVRFYGARGIYGRTNALTMEYSPEKQRYYSLYYAANLIRSKISDMINAYYTGDYAAVLTAVITGDKTKFSEEYEEILNRTATKHLFYPVFLHLMLISFIITLFSGIVSKSVRDAAYAALILLYGLANSRNPVALKGSLVILLLLLSGALFGLRSHKNMTALAVLVLSTLNPLLLYDAGFVYSVVTVILMNLFMPYLKSRKKFTRLFCRYLICFIGLIPISAYFFRNTSPYSFWISLLFLPANAAVLMLSPLLCLNCLLKTPYPTAYLIRPFAALMLNLPKWIDAVPLSSLRLPRTDIVIISAWYFSVGALWLYLGRRRRYAAVCLIISGGLFCSRAADTVSRLETAELHFINVGQGDASLVRVPFSGNILIDGGGSPSYSQFNTGEKIFVPYLYAEGVGVVQAAFVSHFHKDHTEGIVAALKNIKVNNLFLPAADPNNEIRRSLEAAAEENGTKIWYISQDTRIKIDDVTINVYTPDEVTRLSSDENDVSLLIELEFGDFNCLFTGDMTKFSEHNFIKRGKVNGAEVLKAAHHGSRNSNSEEMIASVSPQYTLIGVGEDNEYGLPSDEALDRLSGSQILRTDESGDIVIKTDKRCRIEVTTYK